MKNAFMLVPKSLLARAVPMIVLASCSSTAQNKPELTPEEQQKVNDMVTEMEIGRNMTGKLISAYGINEQKSLTDYVGALGTYVGQNGEWAGRRYMFAVTNDDGVSAYSCPGGYVLMSIGAIRAAQNEAELAGVLGHEIAHVGRQHILTVVKKRANGPSKKGEEDPAILARQREKPAANSKAGSSIAKYLSGPNGATISVLMAASGGLTALLSEGLDHDMEFEADMDGIRMAMRAGYDGKPYINYLRRLGSAKGKPEAAVLDKTHPSMDLRVQKLEAAYEKLVAELPGRAQQTERFKKILASLKSTTKTN